MRFDRLRSSLPSAGPIVRGFVAASAGFTLAAAQTELPADKTEESEEDSGFLAGSLLPNGSFLTEVVLPSYDEHLNLTAEVRARELRIVTREKLDATNLVIQFFNPDSSSRGTIAMANATFLPGGALKLLTTDEPVSFVSEKMKVNGTGLVFDTDSNRGFLRGPVTAVTKTDLRTSMNAKPARQALAAGALLMASAPVLPAQEAALTTAEKFAKLRLTPAQLEQVSAESASKRELVKQSADRNEKALEKVATESDDARVTMNSFFQAASLASLLAEPTPATGPVPRPDVKSDPEEMTVTSKQGVYLDAVEGLAIFLDDVTLKSNRFNMTGAEEVKIFMEPQKEKNTAAASEGVKEDTGAKENPPVAEFTPEQIEKMRAAKEAAKGAAKRGEAPAGADDGEMGDVRRVVATGVIVVDYKPEDPAKPAAKASARTMIYDLENEQIILRGGSPWYIAADGTQAFINGEVAYIVIKVNKDGDIETVVTHDQDDLKVKMKLKEDPAKKAQPNKPKER